MNADTLKRAETSVDILPELQNRWSTRAFDSKPIADEAIASLLEAARWAASSRNEQPWRFLIARKGDPHYDKIFEGLNEWNRAWAHSAPLLLVVLASKHFARNHSENMHAWHDVGLAMGNLSAQATQLGLYLHQMGGIEREPLYANTGIDKEEFDIVSMVAVGYRSQEAASALEERHQKGEESPRTRKALSEIAFGLNFNHPLDFLP